MPEIIPIEPSIPHQRLTTQLSGETYILDARWNARADTWYLDLYDDDEDPIRVGMRVVLGALIGNQSADERFPPGFLVAHDTARSGVEAGLDDFGDRVLLLYITVEEADDL